MIGLLHRVYGVIADLICRSQISLSDRYKRSDAILYFCKVKVTEHYSYPAVSKWLKEKYGHITPQVNYVTKQDISNVSRPWRLLNKDVELRQQVEEESDSEQQRRQCLDSINSTSATQLAKALLAVCTQMPQAIDIVLPFLEKTTDSDSQPAPIKEGADIVIPPPGCPVAKQYTSSGKHVSNYKGVILTPEEVQERLREQREGQKPQQQGSAQAHPPRVHSNYKGTILTPEEVAERLRAQGLHVRPTISAQPPPPAQHTGSPHVPVPASAAVGVVPYKASARGNAGVTLSAGPQTSQRAMSTTWLSSSGPNQVIHTNQHIAPVEKTADSRPSWALPVGKRPAGDVERPGPKRQLVDDIAMQLRKELG